MAYKKSDTGKYKITQTIIDQILTDSDLEDYARDHHLNLKDFALSVSLYHAKGTPCQGCRHVIMGRLYPCSDCIRKRKDHYESV